MLAIHDASCWCDAEHYALPGRSKHPPQGRSSPTDRRACAGTVFAGSTAIDQQEGEAGGSRQVPLPRPTACGRCVENARAVTRTPDPRSRPDGP